MARSKSTRVKVAAGDTVLIGKPGVSMPGDWFVATVLLVADDEVATVHDYAGNTNRQFFPISHIRAVGPYPELSAFKERARIAVDEARKAVDEATEALVKARDAVWAKLDEIGASIPVLEPGDAS